MGTDRSLLQLVTIVGAFVMLCASPDAGAEVMAQKGIQPAETHHLVVDLSTLDAGEPLPGAPEWVYPVQCYEVGEPVWVAVPPMVEGEDLAGTEVRIHLVAHREKVALWHRGAAIIDLSGGSETMVITAGEPSDNAIEVWSTPAAIGSFDVIVDRAPFGVYQPGVDLIDHAPAGGLRIVPLDTIDYLLISPEVGCTRIVGIGSMVGGLYQPDERFIATGWSNGPNGIPENGGGDDKEIGTVSASWSTDVDPLVGRIHNLTGIYIAANYTGEGDVTANHLGGVSGTARTMSTAPDFAILDIP